MSGESTIPPFNHTGKRSRNLASGNPKSNGFSIPGVGYWPIPSIVSFSPYFLGAWQYIKRVMTWARTHGLRTIMDLHSAPGSQKGCSPRK